MTDRKPYPKRRFYVYALYVEDDIPFYVGRGTGARWTAHERAVRRRDVQGNRAKYEIIKEILTRRDVVRKRKLRTFSVTERASAFEVAMIALWGRIVDGGILVNRTLGGEGMAGVALSEETRKKISVALRGQKRSDEFRAFMSKVHTGRVQSPEAIERRAASMRGRKISEEHRQKIIDAKIGVPLSPAHVAAMRGKKRSPEACANIANSLIGRRLSEAHKAKLRGKKHSPETIRKMSLAKIGKTKSEETRANMRAAWVLRKAAKCA